MNKVGVILMLVAAAVAIHAELQDPLVDAAPNQLFFKPYKPDNLQRVSCNRTHSCSSGTCCMYHTGVWGCCKKYSHATCCADGHHCCPQTYRCAPGPKCIKFDGTVMYMEEITRAEDTKIEPDVVKPPMSENQEEASIFLDDSQPTIVRCNRTHGCPTGNTCCKLWNGNWGCCRYYRAVCCSDKRHCCRRNYTCVWGGKCRSREGHEVPQEKKTLATWILNEGLLEALESARPDDL